MEYLTDMEIECINCGVLFIFSTLEQEYYQENGFKKIPHRCPTCREKKSGKSALKVHLAKCKKCGERALLNFEPANPKTVECFSCRKTRMDSYRN